MRTVNISDIRKWKPCYDPAIYRGEAWEGTAIDILNTSDVPAKDRLWMVLREDLIDKTILQEFATWCGAQAKHLIKNDSWTNSDMGKVIEAFPEETQERSAISAMHYASHGMAFEAARDSALALRDTERTDQINKLLELLNA